MPTHFSVQSFDYSVAFVPLYKGVVPRKTPSSGQGLEQSIVELRALVTLEYLRETVNPYVPCERVGCLNGCDVGHWLQVNEAGEVVHEGQDVAPWSVLLLCEGSQRVHADALEGFKSRQDSS